MNTSTATVEETIPLPDEPQYVDDGWVTRKGSEAKIVFAGEDEGTIIRFDVAGKKVLSARKLPRCR